jgi:hypothetical protein
MANSNFHIGLGLRQGWGDIETPFNISIEALRRHVYIVGKTGTGKTSLLRRIFVQLVEHGNGVAILDPHGDLAEELINMLPASLASRVVYFNPGDLSFPIAWNLLANVPPDERPRTASGIVSAFKHVWGDSWGPRLEYILYNAIRALLDADHTSLLGISKMLTEEDYRSLIVRQVQDPFVRAFWEAEFDAYDQRFRQEAIAPILNKVGQLVTNPTLRNILGQEKRKLDISFVMDHQRIFIANLSKGLLGDDPSNLLGSLLISEFERAAMQRGSMPKASRRDFTLMVDEFQNFTTKAFSSILSEARKFRLSLVLSHQFTAQLEPEISEAVFGNVGTLVSFELGSSDAELLAKEYGDAFAPSQFVELDKFCILAKPCAVDGHSQPFRGKTSVEANAGHTVANFHAPLSHPTSPTVLSRQALISFSRQRYGAARKIVEQKIARWMVRS